MNKWEILAASDSNTEILYNFLKSYIKDKKVNS